MSGSVVLLSGGIDSAVVAALEVERGPGVRTLFVDYGQLAARKERVAARRVARLLGIPLEQVEVRLPEATNLGKRKRDLGSAEAAYVRGRNLLLISLATVRLGRSGGRIVIGATHEDAFVDTKTSYFERAAPLLAGGEDDGPIEVVAPVGGLAKRDVVRLAELYGIPLELTWSCYRSGRRPCGHCLSCDHLARALEGAAPPAGRSPARRGGALEPGAGPAPGDLDQALAWVEAVRAEARAARALRGCTFLGPLDPLVERPASASGEAALRREADRVQEGEWRPVFVGTDLEGRERTTAEVERTAYEAVREGRIRRRWVRRATLVVDRGLAPARMALRPEGERAMMDGRVSYILDLGSQGLATVRRPPGVDRGSHGCAHE